MSPTKAELIEENKTLVTLLDKELTFRDLELKFRDGSIKLNAVLGENAGGTPQLRLLCAILLNLLLGEDNEEPPNYRSFSWEMRPAGEVEAIRLYGEIIKSGGKTSHEIRGDLEAEVERLKSRLGRLEKAS